MVGYPIFALGILGSAANDIAVVTVGLSLGYLSPQWIINNKYIEHNHFYALPCAACAAHPTPVLEAKMNIGG